MRLRTLLSSIALLSAGCGTSNDASTLTKLDLSPSEPSIAAGSTLQMTVTGTFGDGHSSDLTTRASFGSSSPSIANFLGAQAGLLTAIAPGTAPVFVTVDGSTATTNVTVTGVVVPDGGMMPVDAGPKISSVAVTPNSDDSVVVGSMLPLTATAKYSDGSMANISSQAAWVSNHSSIAAVDSQGNVTGVTAGTAIISATLDSLSGSVEVTVKPVPPTITAIAISPEPAMIGVHQTVQLKATATYSDGTKGDVTSQVQWNSTMASVATVTGGLLDGVALGMSSISATIGLDEVQFNVTVVAHPVDAGG